MKVAVLIPCYNEEKTIEKVVRDYREVLPDAWIYVYNNNSKDRSEEIVRALEKEDSKVKLRQEYRQGKGNVIRTMFREIDADCYLMIDGDDTYPKENAKEMVDLVLSGRADMVIGDRLSSTYFTENKRPFHNFGNVLVRRLINMLFKSKVNDIMTGYRAFSRAFVKGFPVLSKGFEIETEMTIHAVDKNFKLVEIPVQYRDRPEGSVSKLNTFSDGAKVLKTIVTLFREYKPLFFFSIFAAILFIVSMILFIPVFVEYVKTGEVPRFPTLIVASGFMISSLIAFFVGVLLDVTVKKNKQQYELLMTNLVYSKEEEKE
ncbi:MAG: glycosyltransferase [Lachnospiraceae bacterium]|nr:glycosyltransferase [Lachnospiraceae bacterium]